ncbi:VanZ family protein [Azonexus caeni]|uniref:VanZ family protein n=1 Tax=Azonexus caeni TaxID=266126 RepID=UPI003A843930
MKIIDKGGQIATIVAFVAICWLSVMPSEIAAVDGFNDKAKHVFAFFVLATGMLHYWRISWPAVVVALLGFGIAIEIVQLYVPGRTSSMADVFADMIGIGLGVLGQRLISRSSS